MSLAALFAAGPAHAEITTAHITTPSDPFFAAYDLDSDTDTGTFTVAGTSDGTTGDTVYIVCTGDNGYTMGNLPVGADGSFSGEIFKPEGSQVCPSLAPSPFDPNDRSARRAGDPDLAYSGPSAAFGDTHLNTYGDDVPYDYGVDGATLSTYTTLRSVGGCGLASASPVDATGSTAQSPWDCAGTLAFSSQAYDSSVITVDGKDAFLPETYLDRGARRAVTPSISVDRQFDAATGQWTVKETAPVNICADEGDVPAYSCDDVESAGVTIVRTTTQSQAGRVTTFSDAVSSTDGKQHAVRLLYGNESTGQATRLPGESTYSYKGGAESFDLGGTSTGTIYTESYEYEECVFFNFCTKGAVTWFTAPSYATFNGGSFFELRYDRTIPAGGTTTIKQQYATGFTFEEVQSSAQSAEQAGDDAASPPTVAITSPAANASVSTASVTVVGTAADNGGVQSLKVNGIPTAVGGDGGWSQSVTLAPGVNTITAVATDGAGQSAQAQTSVVYSPPSAPSCKVPSVTGQTPAAAGGAITGAGCSVGNVAAVPSKLAKGTIVSQSRAAGGTLPAFFPIDLVVSSGPVGRAVVTSSSVSVKNGKVAVKVQCPAGGGACAGTLKLGTRSKLGGKKRSLGGSAFSLAAGASKSVSLVLSDANAKRLKGKTVKAYATIAFRDEDGKAQSAKAKVKVKG